MKRRICFAIMLLSWSLVEAQILNETFDEVSNFTTSSPFFSNGDRAFFGITGDLNDFGGDPIPVGIKNYEGFFGNFLTGMRLNGLGASLPITITWENLEIQNITELVFRGDFAEFVEESGHIDSNDFILIEYQIDGEGYQALLSFVGADFSSGSFNGVFREDTNFDGIGDGVALNYRAQRFTKHITETGDLLDLRISLSVNAHEEDFGLDNIILTGNGVEDITPPTILCYEDIYKVTDTDSCGALVNFSFPEAIDETDESPTVMQVHGPTSGSFFSTGSTELIFEATDSAGNTSQCSVYVHIVDKQAPTVICTDPIYVYADEGSCTKLVWYDLPIAIDNCTQEEAVEIELIYGLGSGSYFPVGVNYETYLITDLAGNKSACSIIIEVTSQMIPKLLCPEEPIPVQTNTSGEYILPKLEGRFGIALGDYCNQRGVYTVQNPSPSTILQQGIHEVEINLYEQEEWIDSCIVKLLVQETLGVDDREAVAFLLYPNPVLDILYIETSEDLRAVQIFDIQGKSIGNYSTSSISLAHLPIGIYIITIETQTAKATSVIAKK